MILVTDVTDFCHKVQSSSQHQEFGKEKHLREVVLYHSKMPAPPEDWILFPDEVVVTKHSTIRDGRTRNVKGILRPKDSARPSMERSSSTCTKTITETKKADSDPSKQQIASTKWGSDSSAAKNSTRNPPKNKGTERLLTPDLSDLEEADLWSCCGSSEGSVWEEVEYPNGRTKNIVACNFHLDRYAREKQRANRKKQIRKEDRINRSLIGSWPDWKAMSLAAYSRITGVSRSFKETAI